MRALAKAILPASVQDGLRSVIDKAVPTRRRTLAARRAQRADLAKRVSPDGEVLSGPFQGLRLSTTTSWGSSAVYLSGTYEEALQRWIAAAVRWQPSIVVDIGAAEGYYAVDLGRLLPRAVVHAFDIAPEARRTCKRTVELNGIHNVRVRGRISPRLLEKTLASRSLVICDCEGCELEILDPTSARSLRTAYIIVELHDFIDPAISDVIAQRFQSTHAIHFVQQDDKRQAPRPQLGHLTDAEVTAATDEARPGSHAMRWGVLIPRDH